ncbi:MAG TPA: T9SS type A sorting domain-containing protein [Bacteroidia bacterium]|nr:T9SS type A sorting domain-containing protein [Bacteroidia bacterium]
MKKISTVILICIALFVKADSWTQKANFGGGIRGFDCSFSIGDKGYIGCGGNPGAVNDFWEFDPATNIWTQKADFGGTARVGPVGFSIGAKGYIGTGGSNNDFWEWDQATNIWTQKANYPGGFVTAAVGFSIGNKGYIGTGYGASMHQDFWEWDPLSNTWSQKADLPGSPRWLAVGFSIGNKGYIGTGADGISVTANLLNDFWEWDQTTGLWTQKASLVTERVEASGFSIGNYGFIGVGSIVWGSADIDDLWQYDVVNDTWLQVADFGAGQRELGIGFSIGCKGYFGTGVINDANWHDDIWEYTPDSYVCTTGINETQGSNMQFTISPNPAKEFIVISYPKTGNEKINLTVTDAQSKKVFETQLQPKTSNFKLPTSSFSKGIYFVEISDAGRPAGEGKQKAVRKFIKN